MIIGSAGLPSKKCDGVNAVISFGSLESCVSGLLLIMASAWQQSVCMLS